LPQRPGECWWGGGVIRFSYKNAFPAGAPLSEVSGKQETEREQSAGLNRLCRMAGATPKRLSNRRRAPNPGHIAAEPGIVLERTVDSSIASSMASGTVLDPMPNIIFVSHTGTEATLALRLKELVESTFPGQVRVFVSSDERDLRPGDRWLQEIDNALTEAAALLVVCSPYAVTRPWIYFEAGCAWIRRVPVIPICHSGLEKSQLSPPLSSFQGLTLEDADFCRQLLSAIAAHFGNLEVPRLDFAALDAELSAAARASTTANQASASLPRGAEGASEAEFNPEHLSDDAKRMLFAMSEAEDGGVLRTQTHDGYSLTIDGREFAPTTRERRITAKWERALEELLVRQLIETEGGDEDLLAITDHGYQAVEEFGLVPPDER